VTTAALYCRISRVRRDADGQLETFGVDRQEPPCRQLADRLGWQVAEVFIDNDVSAYNGRHRPGYEAMIEAARTGQVRGIIAWDADRLTRRPVENEALIELADRYGVKLATVTGEYDLATPSGRLNFRLKGSIARYESEHRAERLLAMHEDKAGRGEPNGGPRPFGFERDRVTVRGDEAALIAEAARRVLDGESCWGICKDWTAGGITTTTGGVWKPRTLKRVLAGARLAGLREHRGVVVADATWDPILDEETWRRVKAVLAGQKGVTAPRKYLLTGLVVCGRCGDAKLKAQPVVRKGGSRRSYLCVACFGLSRLAEPLEAHVRDRVAAALDEARLRQAVDDDPEPARILALLQAEDRKLAEAEHGRFVTGELRPERFTEIANELKARMADLERQLARVRRTDLPSGSALLAAWDRMTLDERRAAVVQVVERVIVKPCGRGLRGARAVNKATVEIVWRV
jgi:DNA invertase Pin-like site-specific DNA recombinase